MTNFDSQTSHCFSRLPERSSTVIQFHNDHCQASMGSILQRAVQRCLLRYTNTKVWSPTITFYKWPNSMANILTYPWDFQIVFHAHYIMIFYCAFDFQCKRFAFWYLPLPGVIFRVETMKIWRLHYDKLQLFQFHCDRAID